jgi:exodeoxyribonuclease V alpha subunit
MTVHKSQGSEFNRILLLLPPAFIPLLSRELLYTGITRAHERCDIWASKDALLKTIESRIMRMSGLREKLRGRSTR